MKITLLKKCAVPQSYPPGPNIWRVRFIFMFYVLGPSNQLFQVAYNVAARMGGISCDEGKDEPIRISLFVGFHGPRMPSIAIETIRPRPEAKVKLGLTRLAGTAA